MHKNVEAGAGTRALRPGGKKKKKEQKDRFIVITSYYVHDDIGCSSSETGNSYKNRIIQESAT